MLANTQQAWLYLPRNPGKEPAMSYLIFDLVIAILLVLAVFQGYRRGFVLTLCGFLAVFVAFFGATILSTLWPSR